MGIIRDKLELIRKSRKIYKAEEKMLDALSNSDYREALRYNNIAYKLTFERYELLRGTKKNIEGSRLEDLIKTAFRLVNLIDSESISERLGKISFEAENLDETAIALSDIYKFYLASKDSLPSQSTMFQLQRLNWLIDYVSQLKKQRGIR